MSPRAIQVWFQNRRQQVKKIGTEKYAEESGANNAREGELSIGTDEEEISSLSR
jgi:hypothetical protein